MSALREVDKLDDDILESLCNEVRQILSSSHVKGIPGHGVSLTAEI